jgi:hypothetical protein
MKVKIKITLDQFKNILLYLENSNYQGLSELQVLNIRAFIKIGLKKLIDIRDEFLYNPEKVKTFSVEINQYSSIMALLTNERNKLCPYTLSTFITLQNQNRSILNLSHG